VVVGIVCVKDELDVLPGVIRRMAESVDLILAEDQGSTDGSREFLEDQDSVVVFEDTSRAFDHSAKLTKLAHEAMAFGADWIVPFDADEVWLGLDQLGEVEATMASAVVYLHVATPEDDWGQPVDRMTWRKKEPYELRKVACRAHRGMRIWAGGHGCDYPRELEPTIARDILEVRHFANRSPEQMRRKVRQGVAGLEAAGMPKPTSRHWREWNELDDGGIARVFFEQFWSDRPQTDPSLVFDPV